MNKFTIFKEYEFKWENNGGKKDSEEKVFVSSAARP